MTSPDWSRLAELRLSDWTPVRQLRTTQTLVSRAAVPAVDAHNHLGRWLSPDKTWMIPDVSALVATMDACNVATVVNLDGMWDEEVTANVERYDRAHPGRFVTFCQLDWSLLAQPDGVARLTASLEDSAGRGARGLKVWKDLGLRVRDGHDRLLRPDDPRVVAVIQHAGGLGLPVLIHTADPIAFFGPLDARNERLDELREMPQWWFGDPARFPSFEALLDAHAALVLACPGTTFVGAHAGCAAEDLDRVEQLLAQAPHYTIDTAGRMAELGRQPRRFAALIERFGDRVLFGTDSFPASAEQFRLHFRFFETADECFDYDPGSPVPGQGRWTVSALDLSPDQVAALYRDNAIRRLGLSPLA